jgi:hypothetical protein
MAMEQALGGKPIPMKVGRPAATPAAAPAASLGAQLSSTFSGAPAGDPALRTAITRARDSLGVIIGHILEAEKSLPALLETITANAESARLQEGFHVEEATAFYLDLIAALARIRA